MFTYRTAQVRVSISGVELGDTRSRVVSHLRFEDYRSSNQGEQQESWYRMSSAEVDVFYDDRGYVHRVEGGVPEIGGVDATHWNVEEIQAALGPPSLTGRSRPVGEEYTGHLFYPDHRLLIYRDPSGNRFLLFQPATSS